MVSLNDTYHVLEAVVPLYVAMFLAYASVKWWKLFTPDQCSGIGTFVSNFSVPLLAFRVISTNNPYKMGLKLVFADSLQKLFALVIVAVISKLTSRPILDTVITGFSLSTLSNTLIVGVPILKAMYREDGAANDALAELVVLQGLIWYNVVLFLFELRAAREKLMVTSSLSGSRVHMEEVIQSIETREIDEEAAKEEPPRTGVSTTLILLTVLKKLIKNPNTHATLLGLTWSFISFRWGLKMPKIVDNSVSILSIGGIGMAMFSMGLFMASQPSILACGTWLAILAMVAKFLVGPGLMAVASFAIGLRSNLLKIAIVQAALPQGVVSFVFAKEYDLHANILSTGVALGTLLTIPVTMAYYFLLEVL